MKKVTIRDVAERANCSITTVSKILNMKDQDISQETRQRVLNAIEEIQFIPNQLASGLVTGRTRTIGLIIPDIANPFFPDVARGAEDRAFENGACLLLCNSDNDIKKERQYIIFLITKMVDGIIIAGCGYDCRDYGEIIPETTSVVLVDRLIDIGRECPAVLVDNPNGTQLATEHLITLAHKEIAYIGGDMGTWISQDRLKGYLNAMNNHGLPVRDELVLHGHYSMEWGSAGITKLLDQGINFSAIVCGNDLIALGVQKQLVQRGYRIPEQFSVVGFDDIYISDYPSIQLTTVYQPKHALGYQAADFLMSMLEGKVVESRKLLPSKLVVRSTTGPAPQ